MDGVSEQGLDREQSAASIKWFAPAREVTPPPTIQYLDILADAPRKIDVLLRVDGASGAIQLDLLEHLAQHPKVRSVIVCGVPDVQRALFAVRAVMLGVNIRFCESEEEIQILLHKRRSRVIADNICGTRQHEYGKAGFSVH